MSQRRERKPKFWSRTSPEGPWDVIVIGSGMGGMTAAAMLTKLGRRVLVLEQHYVPGGFTHAFPRKGYEWDVGVHAIGEVTRHSMPGRLLHTLTDGRLEWSSLGEVYEEFYFPGDFRIDFPDNPKQFRANLLEAFPDEQEAIDTYLGLVREVSGSMRGFYLGRAAPRWLGPVDKILARQAKKHLNRTAAEVIAEITDNPKLRTILCAQWGYYGAPPSRSSFAIQALVTKHFLYGGYYPVGGSPEIARGLLKTVADAGGWTRILADVDEILIENDRAVGVRLKHGEEIRAAKIVSAASVAATVRHMLPPELHESSWAEETRKLDPGPAHVCLYVGFKGDIRKAGASGANKWFWNTWSTEDEVWEIDGPEIGPAQLLYCSFPSLKDPNHDPGPELRHTGEVVTFVPWESFEKWQGRALRRRGEEYEELKKRIHDSLLEQYLEHMPELRPMVDYTEVSTPLSTDHFCRPVGGSIYGLEPTPARFNSPWLRPQSPVPGLYFAGCDVGNVGVIGAMMGGVLGAIAVEPVAGVRFMSKHG